MSQFFEVVWTTNLVAGLVPSFPAMAYAHVYVYNEPRAMLVLSSSPGLYVTSLKRNFSSTTSPFPKIVNELVSKVTIERLNANTASNMSCR